MVVALLDLVVMFSFFLSRLVSMMCIVGAVIGLILVYLVLRCCRVSVVCRVVAELEFAMHWCR